MKIFKKILGQTIGSTHRDSQGEKLPKEILEHICKLRQRRAPISQEHKPEKRSIGYMDNFRVVPDPKASGEWFLIADVYFTEEPDDIDIDLGGFSWSITKIIPEYSAKGTCNYGIYLPFPFYNDKDLLNSLHEDESLSLGRWYKKSADPATVALLVGFVLFVLSPAWGKFFDSVLWPSTKGLWSKITDLRKKGIKRLDYAQAVRIYDYNASVYFIPDQNGEERCFAKKKVREGFDLVYAYSETDQKAKTVGYNVVKLYWDNRSEAYKLFHIEYQDGTGISIV